MLPYRDRNEEKKDRVDDAVSATKAALEEGISEEGLPLYNAVSKLNGQVLRGKTKEIRAGARILQNVIDGAYENYFA